MSRSYYKKSNKVWNVLLTIVSLVLVISCIGFLYNHFKDDIKLIGKEEIQVIDGIDEEIKDSDIEAFASVRQDYSPFVYKEIDLYENMRISKVGVPVKTLNDCTKDQTFTLYVVEGDGTDNFKEIEKYKLVIEADTYKDNTVNKWHYFDVKDLKIEVLEGQTLAFASSSDTVIFGFSSNYVSEQYNFYNHVLSDNTLSTGSALYFDVYGYKLD